MAGRCGIVHSCIWRRLAQVTRWSARADPIRAASIRSSHRPFAEHLTLADHAASSQFFAIIITLWALAPKAPASEVFGSFSNFGGWNSIGTACFVGTISATGSFAGSDAPAHLAEEVKDASRAVPRMMMATILLNGTMGFVMIITYVSKHGAKLSGETAADPSN